MRGPSRCLAQALTPGHRTIAWDQRGCGASDWDPACNYYNDTYVRDIEDVVGHLGLEPLRPAGAIRWAASAAYVYAAIHPDRIRRLVIEDAGPGALGGQRGLGPHPPGASSPRPAPSRAGTRR